MFGNENSLNDSKGKIECNYTEIIFKNLKNAKGFTFNNSYIH